MTDAMRRQVYLPVYPAPQPDEVLSHYVIRLAIANGMRPVQLMNTLGLTTFWKRDPDVSVSRDELAVLSTATGIPLERLWECSLMPLLERLHEHPQSDQSPRFLVMTGKHKGIRAKRGHPICPQCAREGRPVQRIWRLTTTVYCWQHLRPLVDHCPSCGAATDFSRHHRKKSHRLRKVPHQPWLCADCGADLDPSFHSEDDTEPMVRTFQQVMQQAVLDGYVPWAGRVLTARELNPIMETVLQLHYPNKKVSGHPRFRPETASVAERIEIMRRAAPDWFLAHREGIPALLLEWRRRGLRYSQMVKWDIGDISPQWWKEIMKLGLSVEASQVPPVLTGRQTFVFTPRQWRIVSQVLPPVPRTSRGRRKPDRSILHAWFTRQMKATRQQKWTGKWSGGVSYPALNRRIKKMAENGNLDRLVEHIWHELPELRSALLAPGIVYDLLRLGCRTGEWLLREMLVERLAALTKTIG